MAVKKKTTKSTRKKKGAEVALARGKRKSAVARAVVKKGTGKIMLNKLSIDAISNRYIRGILLEPVKLLGDLANKVDVKVKVHGGGVMGQMQAARRAIVVGIANFLKAENKLDELKKINRYYVVEDIRRVEPKKYKGRKARARFQKSYR